MKLLLLVTLLAFTANAALPSGACMQRPSTVASAVSSKEVAFATHHTRIHALLRSQQTTAAQTCWFPQTLDHFNRQDNRIYYQRYYVNDAFYEAGSPIFVYIGGEGELSSNDVVSGEIVELASQHSALLLGLEHRFYGQSHPFTSLTPQNLRYLSSQQALGDLASFVKNMSALFDTNDVITVGGSYPGALSAFFRIKFPYLTRGVLASSAPVFAEAAFIQYDQTVAASLGSTCADLIRNGTAAIEARLNQSPSSAQAVKNYFGCGTLEDPVSFLYALADAVAFSVQYDSQSPGKHNGMISQLCGTMANSTYPTLVDAYQAAFTRILNMLGESCLQFSTSVYSMNYTTVDPSMNSRQWYYQSCTEFGFFQVAAPTNSLRSSRITLQWHIDLCTKLFGPTVLGVNFTNTYYGGKSPVATNIYFVNGNIDPWHTLSITSPLPCCPSVLTTLVNGTAHCADLYPSSDSDPASLQQARAQIAAAISSWLPAPDNGGNGKKRLIIGVVVGCFVGLTAIVAFAWYRRRKAAQERDTYATNTSSEVDYSQM